MAVIYVTESTRNKIKVLSAAAGQSMGEYVDGLFDSPDSELPRVPSEGKVIENSPRELGFIQNGVKVDEFGTPLNSSVTWKVSPKKGKKTADVEGGSRSDLCPHLISKMGYCRECSETK